MLFLFCVPSAHVSAQAESPASADVAVRAAEQAETTAPASNAIRPLPVYFVPHLGVLSENGRDGILHAMLTEISVRAEVRFELTAMPRNRIRRLLAEDREIGIVPTMGPGLDGVPDTYQVQMGMPIIFRRDFIFARAGITLPRTVEELKSLTILVVKNRTLPPALAGRTDLTLIVADDDEAAVRMLEWGRADVLVNGITITRAAIATTGASHIQYDAGNPLFVWPAHIAFSRTVDQAVVARIEQAVIDIWTDGTAKRLLADGYDDSFMQYMTVPAAGPLP